MELLWLIAIPLLGGLAAWVVGGRAARWISVAALTADLAVAASLVGRPAVGEWIVELDSAWLPDLGIGFHLALDGLSLLMVLLSLVLGILSVACSWTEIDDRIGFFHFNLMWILAGIVGVFLAVDLFLFYFFWELMLVPMYLLIGIWGHERRIYAAIKFFLFTQLSGLLMLLSILGLAFLHRESTGALSFDYADLLALDVPTDLAPWLMAGFLVAFLVKLPAVPFHTWLPDAHTEAPTAGSVVLAGLLLKTGAYGLIRFAVPLFPDASRLVAPLLMVLGAVGIVYGAWLAFVQTDLKRLVAYTSVSHLGFVLLGVYAFNELALQGVVLQMICHGLSTGALFILAGSLQERLHSREMARMGGFWEQAPRMGGWAMLFAMASLGLPGLGNFVAEILTLIGAWRVAPIVTSVATAGLVLATVYSLWIVQQVFHGAAPTTGSSVGGESGPRLRDLSWRETGIMATMALLLVWLGLYPQPVIDTARPVIDRTLVTEESVAEHPSGTLVAGLEQRPAQVRALQALAGQDSCSALTCGGRGWAALGNRRSVSGAAGSHAAGEMNAFISPKKDLRSPSR